MFPSPIYFFTWPNLHPVCRFCLVFSPFQVSFTAFVVHNSRLPSKYSNMENKVLVSQAGFQHTNAKLSSPVMGATSLERVAPRSRMGGRAGSWRSEATPSDWLGSLYDRKPPAPLAIAPTPSECDISRSPTIHPYHRCLFNINLFIPLEFVAHVYSYCETYQTLAHLSLVHLSLFCYSYSPAYLAPYCIMDSIKKFTAKLKSASCFGTSGTNKKETRPSNNVLKKTPQQTEDDMAGQHQQPISNATATTLNIALQNKSNSSNVFAYITGLALSNNNRPILIQSDGHTVYNPTSPSQTLQPLEVDCAIPLGAPGNTVNVVIPRIAGGRIWFSIGSRLTFLRNPGPAIVEPSTTNPSDLNFNISWTFCEFTYNDAQLFANISYVDFINIPISLSLTNTAGKTQTVPGMAANGFQTVVNELKAQASRDGRPWDQLIYSYNGQPLRAISPNQLLVGNPNAWNGYWDAYVNQVWTKFGSQDITINTQAAAGNLKGRVSNNQLTLGSAGSFSKPSARDIFSCSTGPFATGSNAARNAVIPRLAAAFNRSTLLDTDQFPNGSTPANYYKNATTNHYARIVHQVQRDGRGYAFPYDDVVPDGGSDVAGTVFDGSPQLFTVAVGGN